MWRKIKFGFLGAIALLLLIGILSPKRKEDLAREAADAAQRQSEADRAVQVQMTQASEQQRAAKAETDAKAADRAARMKELADTKAERDKFIQEKLVNKLSIFYSLKVDGKIGTATVSTPWYVVSFDQKKSFASVAWAWCLEQDIDCVTLQFRDRQTNKKVGSFDRFGLKLD